jgi:hypothetical protein
MDNLARAGAGLALSNGLFRIGQIAGQDQQDAETRARQAQQDAARFSEFAALHGGGVGAPPVVAATPAVTETTPLSRDQMANAGAGADLTTTATTPGTPAHPDDRYVAIGGPAASGYILRPDQDPDFLLKKGAQDRANLDDDQRRQLWQDEADRALAQAGYNNRRGSGTGTGGGRGAPTFSQAWRMVTDQHTKTQMVGGRMMAVPDGTSYDQMYDETVNLVKGGRMTPSAPAAPTVTPPPVVPTTVQPTGLWGRVKAIGRIATGGQADETVPADTTAAPATAPSAAAPVAPAPAVRPTTVAPTMRPQMTQPSSTSTRADVTDPAVAQRRAMDLQTQGLNPQQIRDKMRSEGFNVTFGGQ